MNPDLQRQIDRQRDSLVGMISTPLGELAEECSSVWPDRELLNQLLITVLIELPYCKYLYAMDTNALQICDNASHEGLLTDHYGRDRSDRPYMDTVVPAYACLLSESYISLAARRPSITAVQKVSCQGKTLGYIGADFDLRDLPLTRELYHEPTTWQQIKGDPAIRGGLFSQTREDSILDKNIDDIMSLMLELITEHGVFHGKIHFSSSRATIWLVEDPYRYRLLDYETLLDPDICLAYPVHDYPTDAVVPEDKIEAIFKTMKALRYADENIYLRSGSLNIFNGMVGLTFSCDGSHYIPYDEFLEKDLAFWFGQ
ncbi:MAG: PDC sensor domain-containing protein [Gammaproteobacteria bacterium]|nr:PDC sensor domain-containing protein [Gammaproteobacteria bacterium]